MSKILFSPRKNIQNTYLLYSLLIKDGMLTKQEILDKHDVFVGSQVTDFGEALARHDEF